MVVTDGSGAAPRLKARLMATGQEGTFGESGERISGLVEETPSDSRELLARVDFAPDSDAGLESMLGFRQDLGFAGSVQSVAAISVHPGVEADGAEGLDEGAIRSWESMHLGDAIRRRLVRRRWWRVFRVIAEHVFGAAFCRSRLARQLHCSLQHGYFDGRCSQCRRFPGRADIARIPSRNGELAMEYGLHQEIGWERRTGQSSMAVMLFADHIDSPAIEARGHFPAAIPARRDCLDHNECGTLRSGKRAYSRRRQ